MPTAINGIKACSTCLEDKPATAEHFAAHSLTPDEFQYVCRACYRIAHRVVNARWKKTTSGREAAKRYRQGSTRESQRAKAKQRRDERWQRSGSGVHMARIQDWREIFDGFA